jgi:hypothetical protein
MMVDAEMDAPARVGRAIGEAGLMYSRIERCRICGNTNLAPVLDLGEQMLTGVFPRSRGQAVTSGPLRLVKCCGDEACGLLQLEHTYDFSEMYGDNYGYRSGLNASMVAHLREKVRRIMGLVELREGDLVIDIGSNDGTTLAAYPAQGPCWWAWIRPARNSASTTRRTCSLSRTSSRPRSSPSAFPARRRG